ncbi:hypothetical protein NMG60_11021502 [Bertholletia excelsa]
MMKKIIVVALVLFLISSSHIDRVESTTDPQCYDSCNMGCVQYHNNTRLYKRCDRKCQIKCGPDAEADGQLG